MTNNQAPDEQHDLAAFTDQQIKAITIHNKNLVVAAGAGSGKTRVLVERYLRLLDVNDDWKLNSLVAVTFTRAAASEMRDRVRSELEERLRSAHEADDKQARQRWSNLLSQMDSARIATIHSLCGDILRANAAQVGLDPAFEVMDEVDAALLLDDVVADVLRQLAENDDDALRLLYDTYTAKNIHDTLTEDKIIQADLRQQPTRDELLQCWEELWQKELDILRQKMLDVFKLALCLQAPDDKKLAELVVFMQANYQQLQTASSLDWLGGMLLSLAHVNKPTVAQSWASQQILAEDFVDNFVTLKAIIRAWLERWTGDKKYKTKPISLSDDPAINITLDLIEAWRIVIQHVQENYRQAKQQTGKLDFNDLETLTAHLLENFPDVRERYRQQEINHLLVDEFQDTNDLQWRIVSNLADIDQVGKLFIVGDAKQSIYAFRGADVSVFKDVQAKLDTHPEGKRLPLTRSFRSHENLIACFNDFFAYHMRPDDDTSDTTFYVPYNDALEANRPTDNDIPPPLDLVLLRNYPHGLQGTNLAADEMRDWEAYEIATHIKYLIAQKTQVHDKHNKRDDVMRDMQYGDVALLFRSTTQINAYEDTFKAMDIPYVTLSGRGYYNRPEVWDILNLLKALHNPTDNLSLASTLHAPLFNLSDEGLYVLRRAFDLPKASLWHQLQYANEQNDATLANWLGAEDVIAIRRAYRILAQLRQMAGRVPIAQLLRSAVAETGYLAILSTLSGGIQRRRNVEKLIQIAEDSQRITLGDFTRYLKEMTDREVREGEASMDTSGAVQLMTVHASKGLEFPVVFIVNASAKGKIDTSKLVYDDEIGLAPRIYDDKERKFVKSIPMELAQQRQDERDNAESQRLLYVAATRARDKLIVSGRLEGKGAKAHRWTRAFVEWLGLELGMDDATEDYAQPYVMDVANTQVAVHLPKYDAMAIRDLQYANTQAVKWQQIDIPAPSALPPIPPNLAPLEVPSTKYLNHLAASELATIGGYQHGDQEERSYYRQQMRQKILTDQVPRLKVVHRVAAPIVTKRTIGDIVHEALRYWQFPQTTPDIERILQGYAWQFNIVDPEQRQIAVEQAVELLDDFRANADLYREIESAHQAQRRVYKELPFVFNTGQRIIHGVIDVLYEKGDGYWALADYKTSAIKDFSFERARWHAQRYHLQVGVYATAALHELGDVRLDVMIHYLRYRHTVTIASDVWRADLERLEDFIGEIFQIG
jgi:ATP-dependent helicase/nuclease subunit A